MVEAASDVRAQATPRLLVARALVDERLVLCYFIASLILVVGAMLVGFFYSLQFLQVYPFPGIEPLSPGRWRMVHTSTVVYGFIANAFLGGLHWAIPRLTLRAVLSRRLSWFIFFAWQAVVIAIAVGLVLGHAQPIEWGETPVWIDSVLLVGLFLVAVNLLTPVFGASSSRAGSEPCASGSDRAQEKERSRTVAARLDEALPGAPPSPTGPLYVSLWYFIAGLVGALLAYAVGNFAPKPFLHGDVAGMFLHHPVGLFVTPIGCGLMYYFVPIILNTPIWSHRLALAGFWGLVFFYPLNAVHRCLRGSTSMFLTHEALIPTLAIGLVTLTMIVNFFATVHGSRGSARTSMAIRWFYLGMVFYLVALVQYAAQMATSVREVIPLTDWVVAHAHLVLFGVFGFWIMGMMTHLLPRLLGADRWYNPAWSAWHFWLSGIGMLVMFIDLMTAGVVQGSLWNQLAPWEESVIASAPFWLVRTTAGVVIIVGSFFLIFNILMTVIHERPVTGIHRPAAKPVDSSEGANHA